MRRETKIGLLAALSIVLLIWGYQYLKGINILSSSTILYAEYDNVGEIRESTPIFINGFQVGLVASIYQKAENLDRLVVEMNIDAGVKIPKDAVAAINVKTLMGDKAIDIYFEKNCTGSDCAQHGDYLKGITKGMLGSMVATDDLQNYMTVLETSLQKIIENLKTQIGDDENVKKTLSDVSATMSNLKSTTARLNNLLASSSGAITGTMKNFKSITDTIDASSSEIKSLIGNADAFASKLNNVDMEGTLEEAKHTFEKLQGTLTSADKAVAELTDLLAKVKSSDGALGMLLNDKTFADSLRRFVRNTDLLMQDLRLHPERYRRVLSKKKMEYEYEPEQDPAWENKN